jgi:hydrogenase-4 component F
METLPLLIAIPLTMALLSLVIPRVGILRPLVAAAHWVQLVVVIWFTWPLLTDAVQLIRFTPDLAVDKLAAAFIVLTTLATAASVTQADCFFQGEEARGEVAEPQHVRMLYASINALLLAMTCVFLCDNLGFMWISVEASTLSSAPIALYARTKNALEATWKYLIVCSVGIAFALLGTVFVFASSQHGAITGGSLNISELLVNAKDLSYPLLRLGFIFCILGYGTKAGIFPLHSWLPDAYSQAPPPGAAVFSGALLNCALFAIFRVSQIVIGSGHAGFSSGMLMTMGTISVLAASLLLVRQNSLKRLWAYSSIENVGLMLVAIGLGSGTLFFFQALNHSIAKVALFLLTGNISQAAGTARLNDLRGILGSSPMWGVLLALSTFAVAGTPPFGSFLSEIAILAESSDGHHWVIALTLVLSIAVAFVAMCAHVGAILFGAPKEKFDAFKPMQASVVPAMLVACSLILGVAMNQSLIRGLQ